MPLIEKEISTITPIDAPTTAPLMPTKVVIVDGMAELQSLKVHMTRNFFISLFERAFKMMKNGVYFIVIALLVAELFKILIYAN